jgi:hypothetical protein
MSAQTNTTETLDPRGLFAADALPPQPITAAKQERPRRRRSEEQYRRISGLLPAALTRTLPARKVERGGRTCTRRPERAFLAPARPRSGVRHN